MKRGFSRWQFILIVKLDLIRGILAPFSLPNETMANQPKSLDEIKGKLLDLWPQTDGHALAHLLSSNNVNVYGQLMY